MASADQVAEIRRFNRFYTQLIGVLDEGHLASAYSLAQVRTLYELADHDVRTASALCARLGLDPGYASRLLRELEARGLVTRARSTSDGRQVGLELTARGRAVAAELDRKAAGAIDQLLSRVPEASRRDIVAAMQAIRAAFDPPEREP